MAAISDLDAHYYDYRVCFQLQNTYVVPASKHGVVTSLKYLHRNSIS